MKEVTSGRTSARTHRARPRPGLPAAARRRWRLLFFAATVYGVLSSVAAEATLFDKPVFEPVTGNYFELRKVTPGYSLRGGTPAIGWEKARILAAQSVYKGARGRLAVVKRKEVNDFLRRTFEPDLPAWIGLRYWCEFNKLQWVTGEIHDRTAYTNWGPVWRNDGGSQGGSKEPNCDQNDRFWPVHYWPMQDGFRWNANGAKKEMRAFFIEYPTGER